ncbi:MAG: CPBP family intramembrane glutamic endopeptidase [Chlorobium sp.]
MNTSTVSDPYVVKRPAFFANTSFLITIMVLYPLTGTLLFTLVDGGTQVSGSLLRPDKSMLPIIRMVQSAGEIFILALPVLFLSALHTGSKHPFSSESLAFLGIGKKVDFQAILLGVCGILLLQPLLLTLTAVQDLYLWPSLGEAGADVLRQRAVMDLFIRNLALVRNFPEFLLVAFVLALTPAFCEELFFRGYIQQNYTRSISSGGAVLLTGFIFAFFHLSAANLLPLALLGCYIGYIYSKTGNLAIPFSLHFINNLAALLLLLFTEDGDAAMGIRFESMVTLPWWWLIVLGSLFLFVKVILRFRGPLPSAEDLL